MDLPRSSLRGSSALAGWIQENSTSFVPPQASTRDLSLPLILDFEETTTQFDDLFIEPSQYRRRQDEVERVGTLDCRLTTSLQTPYRARNTAKGTMFTVDAKDEVEVLGVEFDAYDFNVNGIVLADLSVQVYYKEGEFAGFTGDETLWTELADSQMFLAPDKIGAIVPAKSFTPVTLEAGKRYSFYLSFPTEGVLKIQNSQELLGSIYQSDFALDLFAGVSLDSGPFPSTFDQVADFAGKLHYRSLRSCSQALTITEVTLEFAINDDPETNLMNELANAVGESINALAILNPDLSRFKKNHMLALNQTTSHFQGLNPEICAAVEFNKCSLIDIRLKYLHLRTIEPGELQQTVLKESIDIAESVAAQVNFDVSFVGKPIEEGEYLVTLDGVPRGVKMNPIQKRYFERVTTNFLKSFSDLAIYTIEVTNEVVETDEEAGISRRRNLRGTNSHTEVSRSIQQLGETTIVISMFGAGTEVDLRTAIFTAVGDNQERFKEELILQQLRPGEINQENSGSHFENVNSIVVAMKPDDFDADEPIIPENSGEEEPDYQTYILLCYFGVAISILFLLYRIIEDCCPSQKKAMTGRFCRSKSLSPDDNESDTYAPEKEIHVQEITRKAPKQSRSFSGPFQRTNKSDTTSQSGESHDDSQVPMNRAGQNGRGIRATRSLDALPSRRPPPRRRNNDIDGTSISSASHQDSSLKPMNKAGRNGRGVQPTKSLPSITMPKGKQQQQQSVKRKKSQSSVRDDGSISTASFTKAAPKNRAGQNGRGVRPTRSMPNFTGNKSNEAVGKNDTLPKVPKKPKSMENLTKPHPTEGKKKKKKKVPNTENGGGLKKKKTMKKSTGVGKKKKKTKKPNKNGKASVSKGTTKPKKAKSSEPGSVPKVNGPKRTKSAELKAMAKVRPPQRSKSAELRPVTKPINNASSKRINSASRQTARTRHIAKRPNSNRKDGAANKSMTMIPTTKKKSNTKDDSDWSSSSDSEFGFHSSDDESSVDCSVGTFESFSNIQHGQQIWDEGISSSEEESSVGKPEPITSKTRGRVVPWVAMGMDGSVRSIVSHSSKNSRDSFDRIDARNSIKTNHGSAAAAVVVVEGIIPKKSKSAKPQVNQQDSEEEESEESDYESDDLMPNKKPSISSKKPPSSSTKSSYQDSESEESDFSLGQNQKYLYDSDSE